MTKQEYADAVMARLPELQTDHERALFRSDAESRFDAGWELEDTIRWMRYTEHVNPDIPEVVALRRMGEISAKYRV